MLRAIDLLGSPWLSTLADAALKSTLILLAAALAAALLRRRSAALRHLVWSAALGATLATPLMGLVVPAWKVAVLPAGDGRRATGDERPAALPPLAPVPNAPPSRR